MTWCLFFIWHQPHNQQFCRLSNQQLAVMLVKGLNYWRSSDKSTWKWWSWVKSLFHILYKQTLGQRHKVEISSLATFHIVSTLQNLNAGYIFECSLPCGWCNFSPIILNQPLVSGLTTSFLVSTVSWMSLTTRLPLSFCSLVSFSLTLRQPSHKPQLPSIPWRGRQRLHAADYEINIRHKPLTPQNYFMRSTLCHWEKHHLNYIIIT